MLKKILREYDEIGLISLLKDYGRYLTSKTSLYDKFYKKDSKNNILELDSNNNPVVNIEFIQKMTDSEVDKAIKDIKADLEFHGLI